MKPHLEIRFLVVDDEESIRRLCMTVAQGLGFICMEASTGEAALALLEEQLADLPLCSNNGFSLDAFLHDLLPVFRQPIYTRPVQLAKRCSERLSSFSACSRSSISSRNR